MPVTIRAAFVAALCAIAGACVQADVGGARGSPSLAISLEVLDQRQLESERDAIPRRPLLRLEHRHGLQPDPAAVLLLSGQADADLRDDLSAAPLRAEHAAQVVPAQLTLDGDALVLAPLSTLDAAARYTLAVAGNARDSAGKRVFADGTPWLVELQTEPGPEAGARVLATWPADGAAAVPTNLVAAVIALDGDVFGVEDGAWLEDPDGLAVPAQIDADACSAIAPEHDAASCIRITLGGLLAPGAPYAIVLGSAARDAHGAAIGPFRASFRTAGGPDLRPPSPRLTSCAIDEQATEVGCALLDDQSLTLHVVVDEPALFTLQAAVPAGGAELVARAVGPSGDASLQLSGLEPDRAYPLELTLRDAADNVAHERFELHTEAPLASLSIVELRADPLGPEPAQELVELLNYGTRAIALQGFVLSDRLDAPGMPIAVETSLPPAGRALLVADAFDPHEPSETQPPAGALLVHVGKALASSGLRNSGEALYLRDPDGRRISAAPSTPPPRAGVCLVRISDDMRSGATGAFDYAGDEGCTPGW